MMFTSNVKGDAMLSKDVHWLPIVGLSDLLARREISPVELSEAMLDRIEQHDGTLRSYETVARTSALAAAKAVEAEIGQGGRKSVLHGVPIAVKDLYDTEGIRTAAGTRILNERIPTTDATVVARLKSGWRDPVGQT